MVIDATPYKCIAPEHAGKSAICIEFIAVAPWNYEPMMTGLLRKRFLRGIGPVLMNAAINVSKANGCDGRLVLFSVDKRHTQNFYERECRMIKMGAEQHHNDVLTRFEMTSEQALTLVNGRKG